VVIVKNLEDKDIDDYIAKLGYKNIILILLAMGSKLA